MMENKTLKSCPFCGGDEPENLVTLCVDCHKEMHKIHKNYNLED